MSGFNGVTRASGSHRRTVVPQSMGLKAVEWSAVKALGLPQKGLTDEVNEWRLANSKKIIRRFKRIRKAHKYHAPLMVGSFSLAVLRQNGEFVPFGLTGLEVVTNAFVAHLTDQLQASTGAIDLFRWHAAGQSTAAAAATNTGLGAELTAAQQSGGGRASGTQTEGASTNIYETVGTVTIAATGIGLTESGIFNSSSTGSGTLLDRDVYAVINLSTGESLQTTYDLTLPSGG